MNTAVKQLERSFVMPTYVRPDMVLEKGKGMYLFDRKGNRYLDFIGGIATCPVGHGHDAVARTLTMQARKLINASNLYYTEPQTTLARRLSRLAEYPTKAFFSNSGAEAVEAAIKLARKHSGKRTIIAARGAFHGRTMGALSATWKNRYRAAFRPLVRGFRHIPYNDPDALARALTADTAAFIVEPIQGEEGVVVPDKGYLQAAYRICRKKKVLFIIDEVQTGIGRTGKFFAFQHENIKPEIITMAKGLASGVPIGVTLARKSVADAFEPGDHGSTFGGNSLAAAVANTVLDIVARRDLAGSSARTGTYFMHCLRSLQVRHQAIKQVRGVGLMIGMEVSCKAQQAVEACRRKGLLVGSCGDHVIRFLPPLIVRRKNIDTCVSILNVVLGEVRS